MFATTEALAFPRSAELARSFKNVVFEDGGVQNISRIKIYRRLIFNYSPVNDSVGEIVGEMKQIEYQSVMCVGMLAVFHLAKLLARHRLMIIP